VTIAGKPAGVLADPPGVRGYPIAMNDEFSARRVATEVLTALERRRDGVVDGSATVEGILDETLGALGVAYREAALPPSYWQALEAELRATIPGRWRPAAAEFTALERRGFGSWRGGDVYARVVYALAGLLVGGLCVALPFIPIWEKWFPFAVGVAAWWLPDAQAAWHRRRHGRMLGRMVRDLAARQPALESRVSLAELTAAGDERE
jgi:hypothetical protein